MYFSAFFETLEASLFIYQSGSRQNNPNKEDLCWIKCAYISLQCTGNLPGVVENIGSPAQSEAGNL